MVGILSTRAPSRDVVINDHDQVSEPFKERRHLVTFRPSIAYLTCFARRVASDIFFKGFRVRVDLRAATIRINQRHIPCTTQDGLNRARLRLTNERCLIRRRLVSVAVIKTFRETRFDRCHVNFHRFTIKVITVYDR